MSRKKRADKSGGAKGKPSSQLPGGFFDMEPDLQTLNGLLLAARILGDSDDHIEPAAVGAIADCGLAALKRVTSGWRSLLDSDHGEESV